MEYFETIWNGPSRYVLILIAVIIIVYIPYSIIRLKTGKRMAGKFLQEHPDAAKAIIKGAAQGNFMPLSVNNEPPVMISVGAKAAFYLIPGENIIEFQYTWVRPGVMYKSVSTTIGPTKISVQAEAFKTYNISYDKKAETCKFEEI